MSSCDSYGTQCIDTGKQLTANSVAFDDSLIESGCASVQCVLDKTVLNGREHVADKENPHEVDIDQVPHALDQHTDVSIPSPQDGQVVSWSDADGAYIATNPVTGVTDHLLLSNIGTNTHDIIDEHLANLANPHMVTAAQSGAEPENANIQAHIADVTTNPHNVLTGYKNILINPSFRVNQREGTKTPGIGVYGYDRWKGHANGLEQLIEEGGYLPSITYTLSNDVDSPAQIVSPASGDWSITVPNTITWAQLEQGNAATNREIRPLSLEFQLCHWYYIDSGMIGYMFAATATVGTLAASVYFPNRMRATPAITMKGGTNVTPTSTLPHVLGFSMTGSAVNTGLFSSYNGYIADAEL